MPNSGFSPGKFLECGKYKNVNNNNEYFKVGDFIVGTNVTINSYEFEIFDADKGTKDWQNKNFKFPSE